MSDLNETSEIKTPEVKSTENPVEANGKLPTGVWLTKRGEVSVIIYVYRKKDSEVYEGTMSNAMPKESMETMELIEIPIKAKFSMPNRKQLQRYREKSGRWVAEAGSLLTDRQQMRNHILKFHLLDIDIIDPETGAKLDLTRDADGRMSPEVESRLDDLHPTILDVLMNKYDAESGISY